MDTFFFRIHKGERVNGVFLRIVLIPYIMPLDWLST